MNQLGKKDFDFNLQNKVGISEIIYGKGIFNSISFAFITLIFIVGLILMPWKISLGEMTFKGIIVLVIIYIFQVYLKSIIKISFDHKNLYIKTWKHERVYVLEQIKDIRLTYYSTCGFAKIRIIAEKMKKSYHLWTTVEDRERHKLFENMKAYIESKEWRK